jgi:DNA polymerase zeta
MIILGYQIRLVVDELELIQAAIEVVREFDPDLLLGYEIQSSSWGYLFHRAEKFQMDFGLHISRMKVEKSRSTSTKEENPYGHRKTTSLTCTGRIFLNVWRLMRSELALTSYTLENVSFKVLNQRFPKFSNRILSSWYDSGLLSRWRTYKYYFIRTQLSLMILYELDVIGKTR